MITRENQHLIFGKPNRLGWISGRFVAGFILILFLFFIETQSKAQVQATGHVFAEIIEPTALTAEANNIHLITDSDKNIHHDLFLAEVKLSGSDVNIDVSIHAGDLQSTNGETLQFEAIACPECSSANSNLMGNNKLFSLTGTPGNTEHINKNSTFTGQYQVIFMYN